MFFLLISLHFTPGRCASLEADPGEKGPLAVRIEHAATKNPETGNDIPLDLYFPEALTPSRGKPPLIVFLHGFQQSKSGLRDSGRHLASWGFVVVIPTLKIALLKPSNIRRLSDLRWILKWIRNPDLSGSLISSADLSRLGLIGFSAGGLTVLEAGSDPGIKSIVGLDTVISSGPPGNRSAALDAEAAGLIRAPVMLLEGPPHGCNNYRDRGVSAYPWLGSRIKARYEIISASHCDFTDASRLCGLACGASSEARRKLIRGYFTSWMIYYLKNDKNFASPLYGAGHGKAVDSGRVRVLHSVR